MRVGGGECNSPCLGEKEFASSLPGAISLPSFVGYRWENDPQDPHHAFVTAIEWDKEGENLITGDEKGTIRVWNMSAVIEAARFEVLQWGTTAAQVHVTLPSPFHRDCVHWDSVRCVFRSLGAFCPTGGIHRLLLPPWQQKFTHEVTYPPFPRPNIDCSMVQLLHQWQAHQDLITWCVPSCP